MFKQSSWPEGLPHTTVHWDSGSQLSMWLNFFINFTLKWKDFLENSIQELCVMIHMYIKETLEFHGDKNGAWKLENGANTFNESGWPFTCICFVLIATWSILMSERLKIGSADLHCPIFWKPSHDWGSYYIPLVYIYFVLFANLMLSNPNEENSTSTDLYKLTWTPTTS